MIRNRGTLPRAGLLGVAALTALVWLFAFVATAHAQTPPVPPPSGTPASAPPPATTASPGPTTAAVAVTDATSRRLFGAEVDTQDAMPPKDDGGTVAFGAGDILNLIVRLAAVAGIIYLAVWLLRRWMRRNGGPAFVGGRVRVLETMGLAANRLLYVVDVGDKVLLVGATPQQLSLLTELTDDDTIAAFRAGAGARPAFGGFADHLRGLTARLTMPKNEGARANFRSLLSPAAPDPSLADRDAMIARLRQRHEQMQRRRATSNGEEPSSAAKRGRA